MRDKKYSFYYNARNEKIADYYFSKLSFYAIETLGLEPQKQCLFYGDIGDNAKDKYKLMDNLENIQCVVLPAYHHLNPSRVLFYELYEQKFRQNGINLLCLDEEVSRDE